MCGVQRDVELRLESIVQIIKYQVVLRGNLGLGLWLEVVIMINEISLQCCEDFTLFSLVAKCDGGVFDSF